eukprot:7594740-Alexandrium_andersonii.AAC.1
MPRQCRADERRGLSPIHPSGILNLGRRYAALARARCVASGTRAYAAPPEAVAAKDRLRT